MDGSYDCVIRTEKENQAASTSRVSTVDISIKKHRQLGGKAGFKSLTSLSTRDSLENLQKLRRRIEVSRRFFFNRNSGNAEKRIRKKYHKKCFDKANVSEIHIRKATHDLVDNKPLTGFTKFGKTVQSSEELRREATKEVHTDENTKPLLDETSQSTESANLLPDVVPDQHNEIVHCLEKLRLGESGTHVSSIREHEDVKSTIDYASGDVRHDDYVLDLNVGLGLTGDHFAGMASAQLFDSKRRSVQWNREVDVIYYAGDSDGGRVVRRENEPLRDEADQQASQRRFIKNLLLSNVSACQFREPWLVVLPK